ncbi:hypothetical protein KY290_019517 [Solanum tuberosum]|uniref:Uncharacterized protein n=1 Tax=Solanum tuberosum TaxID=4113 RepID=A0ABQ7VHA1_SOLTU|nr:hypothetical protein KY289_018596 [Solanum tuberosum]KAH0763444.1 hypothetical protein KY290_019517 [Solanum tuberosum]
MPKYCTECCLQGHDEQNCCTIHPELYATKSERGHQKEEKGNISNIIGTLAARRKTLTSSKVIGNKQNRQEWMVRRRNKYKRDKYGHIERKIDYQDKNNFEALRELVEEVDTGEIKIERESTKDWVNKIFTNKEQRDNQEVKENVNKGNGEIAGAEQSVDDTI